MVATTAGQYKDALDVGGIINKALLNAGLDIWKKTPFSVWPVWIWYLLLALIGAYIIWWFLKNFIL